MKKIIYAIVMVSGLFVFGAANAQYCGSGSGQGVCVPLGTLDHYGLENSDSVPCIVQGEAYSQSIQIKMFNFFEAGGPQTVDSIEFDGINNLPCGLCWATNKANNRYSSGEFGCINISGTTTDDAGQYKLLINLKAWINGSPGIPVGSSTVDNSGIKIWLRVQAPAGVCNAVDTSSSASNKTASTGCTTGINAPSNDILSLNVIPNPVNSTSIIRFGSLQEGRYTLNVTDIAGRVISTKEIESKVGENSLGFETSSLPAGMYFLSLYNGKNSSTKRFIVLE